MISWRHLPARWQFPCSLAAVQCCTWWLLHGERPPSAACRFPHGLSQLPLHPAGASSKRLGACWAHLRGELWQLWWAGRHARAPWLAGGPHDMTWMAVWWGAQQGPASHASSTVCCRPEGFCAHITLRTAWPPTRCSLLAFKLMPLRMLGADGWKVAAALTARHIGGEIGMPCSCTRTAAMRICRLRDTLLVHV